MTGIKEKIKRIKIAVIGDIMLDKYLFGKVERISPEAPVPVVKKEREEFRLGGAGNTAKNIKNLGADVLLISIAGKDGERTIINNILEKEGIKRFMFESENPTITKTRVVSGNHQLLRIDREEKFLVSREDAEKAVEAIKEYSPSVIVVSDYAKGFINKDIMEGIKKLGIRVVADFKPANWKLFKGVFAVCPNIKEAKEISGKEKVEEIGKELVERIDSNVIITRGSEGVSLFEKGGKEEHFETKAKEVFDVSGAGDTFTAAFAVAIAAGAGIKTSVEFANNAAGVVVGKFGTSSVRVEEIEIPKDL